MSELLFVCYVDELTENKSKRFSGEDFDIALFNYKGGIFAVDNVCPHQHRAEIYQGEIKNGCVVCPAHGWKFDLRTGNKVGGNKGLNAHEVKISGGKIFVKPTVKKFAW